MPRRKRWRERTVGMSRPWMPITITTPIGRRHDEARRRRAGSLCSCRAGRNGALSARGAGSEDAFEISHRLPQSLLVFHERDSHEAFPMLAEGAAWRDGDLGFVHHSQAKVDGAFIGLIVIGVDFGPDEHAGAGLLIRPAELIQAPADFIAAFLVHPALLAGRLRAFAHGNHAGDLDGGEHAVVVV